MIWITAKIKKTPLQFSMERLDEIRLPQGRKRIVYEHNWRSEFVGEALTIEFENNQEVVSIEFYSSHHGIVRWVRQVGFLPSHSWESERTLCGKLHGQHYPAALLNGEEPFKNTINIVQDVLKHDCLAHLRPSLSVDKLHGSKLLAIDGKV